MGNERTDGELLDRFARQADEAAFRTLVVRYSGLVFHTAFRVLNDRPLTEDVGQRVFLVLAKKAAAVARGAAPLPSWLHHTTLLEAKAVRRAESRHHRKKEALMNEPADPPREASVWRDALPHLDAAIDSLPEADRDILLLHFVNELTFPEIASRLGGSASAVQKRSRRALESLRIVLGRKGVALSIGVLTAGLTTEMTKASPVLLTPALGSALGKTTTLFAVKKTTVAAVSATALLCAVPLARQQATIGKLEARLADAILLEQLASRSRSADSRAAAGMSFLQRLARDLKSQNSDVPRYVSAIDHLDGLENGELVALARETAISSLSFEDRETILGCAFGPLARRDPQLALDALLEIPEPYRGKSFSVESLMQGVLRAYADENSAAALAWFTDHIELIRSIPGRENHRENSRENSLRQSLAYGFIEDDPEQAVRILRPVPKGLLLLFFQQYVQSREPSLRENAQGYIDVARGLLPEHEAGLAIGHLIHVHWVDWDESAPLAPIEKLLENFEFSGAETEALLRSSGEWRLQSASYESADQFKAEFLRFHTLFETYLRDRTDHLAGRILFSSISATNPEWVAGILADRKSIGLGDDAVAGFLAGMEENPTVLVNLDVLGRIRDSVTDSDAIQATFDRVLSRHSFMNR